MMFLFVAAMKQMRGEGFLLCMIIIDEIKNKNKTKKKNQ